MPNTKIKAERRPHYRKQTHSIGRWQSDNSRLGLFHLEMAISFSLSAVIKLSTNSQLLYIYPLGICIEREYNFNR